MGGGTAAGAQCLRLSACFFIMFVNMPFNEETVFWLKISLLKRYTALSMKLKNYTTSYMV